MKNATKTVKLISITYAMAIVTTFAALASGVCSGDVSSITTIACAWVAETAVFSGFYAWKSKNENRQKYAMKWVKEINETMPPEMAARFAEIVLKD